VRLSSLSVSGWSAVTAMQPVMIGGR